MANITSNIFGLSDLNKLQIGESWPKKTREEDRQYGYTVGGTTAFPIAAQSFIQRIDYSNDTIGSKVRGSLTTSRARFSAVSNATAAWFLGAIPSVSSTERMTYANDTVTVSRANLVAGGTRMASSFDNERYGWICGGFINNSAYTSIIYRLDFANDSNAVQTRGTMSAAKGYGAGVGNQSYGYFFGGNGPRSTVERIDLSNDLGIGLVRSNLASGNLAFHGEGNNNFGWVIGGTLPSPATIFSRVERLDYSNDTVNPLVKASLDRSGFDISATGNSNKLYAVGGATPATGPYTILSTVSRINYYNDTVSASIRGPLSSGGLAGTYSVSPYAYGGSPNTQLSRPYYSTTPYGYFMSGSNPTTPGTYSTVVDRIDYANDTATATQRTSLITGAFNSRAVGNHVFGYIAGGTIVSVPASETTRIERIDYANDTSTTKSRGFLTLGRAALGATGNTNFGYFGGGRINPGPRYSNIERISYANDIISTSNKSNFTANRDGSGCASTYDFGWFAGGTVPYRSSVDRLSYSSDTVNCVLRGPLTATRSYIAGNGNDNFAYISGGFSPAVPGASSTVHRIEYANDTATALVRGPLNVAKYYLQGTGNPGFGYIGNGTQPGGAISTVDRIDYSNDTVTAGLRGKQSSNRSGLSAVSPQFFGGSPNITQNDPIASYIRFEDDRPEYNNVAMPQDRVLDSYGYFSGGRSDTSTSYTTINRIDFSNDTETASSRGKISDGLDTRSVYNGNTNFGWGAGGGAFTPANSSCVRRIDYSNDTNNTIRRGNMVSSLRNYSANIGTNNHGYWAGGGGTVSPSFQSPTTSIERIDYANDIVLSVARGSMTAARGYSFHSGASNQTYGYMAGGVTFPAGTTTSSIERFQFATDFANTMIRNNLTTSVSSTAGSGNENFGYWAGGGSSATSVIQRMDYSNDTTNASLRGNLSLARTAFSSANSSNYAWFGGGYVPGSSPYGRSVVDRIQFSNDTITASVRGPLITSVYYAGGLSNARGS